MIEQQLNILKFMSEVTGRVDMNEFAKRVCLTPSQTVEQVRTLAKAGFVAKTATGYVITEKGKNAIKATAQVPVDKSFQFYLSLNQPTDAQAATLLEFHDAITKVDVASLEFHLSRGDFENWLRTTINDAAFADEVAILGKEDLKGEALRQALLTALESRYSLQPT